MIGKLKWEDVYLLWNNESYNFPKILSDPMTAKTVFVEYDGDGYIYGFDWFQNNREYPKVCVNLQTDVR